MNKKTKTTRKIRIFQLESHVLLHKSKLLRIFYVFEPHNELLCSPLLHPMFVDSLVRIPAYHRPPGNCKDSHSSIFFDIHRAGERKVPRVTQPHLSWIHVEQVLHQTIMMPSYTSPRALFSS